jgi:signal transduction histidine kinase
MGREKFTVDAALLEELGERLIGRRHIALAEIIKNAYDADAYLCEVEITANSIVVTDNGVGMDLDTFKGFYLRLAAQHKRQEEVSPELGRRLTGSKGIGRLAAQFLGFELEIETARKNSARQAVYAKIDWSKVVRGKNLESFRVDVQERDRDSIQPFADGKRYGTRVTVKNLKLQFGEEEIEDLGRELWSLRSPFERAKARGRKRDPHDFDIDFKADLEDVDVDEIEAAFDRVLIDLTEHVWRAKITGSVRNGRDTDVASIAIEFTSNYPSGSSARTYPEEVRLSSLKWKTGRGEWEIVCNRPLLDRVDFTIYVYKLYRRQPANVSLDELKDYLEKFGNVGIFDAGFRLPYYGISSDWLENGADHARRLSTSSLLPPKWKIDERYMLDLPEPRRLFGHVEISTNHEESAARKLKGRTPALAVQVGRDRLVDNDAHRQLQALVRYSLDLYANRYRARVIKSVEDARGTEPGWRKYSRLRKVLEENRDVMPGETYRLLDELAEDAEEAAKADEARFDARTAAIAPLAAAGMTALGMTHELVREARLIERARRKLMKLAKDLDLPELADAARELGDSLTRLRSLQSLFSPLLSEEDREGDSRLLVRPVVRQVAKAMEGIAPGLTVDFDVDDKLRFPSGPLAAWNAILQNLIANSWNASLGSDEAKVFIESWVEDGWEGVMISDKGVGLDFDDSERLFDAFERDLEVAPEHSGLVIGGHGLGLAIVRMLCEKYSAEAWFHEPQDGYATTLSLSWKV